MISPRAPPIGLPTLRLSSQASSSLFFLIRSASLARERPRLPAAQLAQPLRSSNALRAAATARSTSSRPPSGAVAIVRPVAGSMTSNVWPSAASTASPPMSIRAAVGAAGSAVVVGFDSVVMVGTSDAGVSRREQDPDDTPGSGSSRLGLPGGYQVVPRARRVHQPL